MIALRIGITGAFVLSGAYAGLCASYVAVYYTSKVIFERAASKQPSAAQANSI